MTGQLRSALLILGDDHEDANVQQKHEHQRREEGGQEKEAVTLRGEKQIVTVRRQEALTGYRRKIERQNEERHNPGNQCDEVDTMRQVVGAEQCEASVGVEERIE